MIELIAKQAGYFMTLMLYPFRFITYDNIISRHFSVKPKQPAVTVEFKKYNRRYITFNFKGKGNAKLRFYNKDKSRSFQVGALAVRYISLVMSLFLLLFH